MNKSIRKKLTPGKISPIRKVPKHIVRPEYVGKKNPKEYTGSNIQSEENIEKMQIAGKIAAQAIHEAGKYCIPGNTTDSIDKIVHEFICDNNAYPSTLGYRGFPKSACTSINEVICHGIPDTTVLEDGDIINLDVTAYKNGVHGDTSYTFMVGNVDEESKMLVERTYESMMRAIKNVKPGHRISTIGKIIESYAKRFNYGVVEDFTGHGIGTSFHTGLIVPHYDASPDYNDLIEVGMTFTIEPMLTLGTVNWDMWKDGWTIVTKDRKRTAQFEHTVVVSEDGAKILTLP